MKKKLLGLVMVGILATTSLPAVTATAATSNVTSVVKINSATSIDQYPWAEDTILTGAKLYLEPYSDCYGWTVQENTNVKIKRYDSKWIKVEFSDGSIYYIYGNRYIVS